MSLSRAAAALSVLALSTAGLVAVSTPADATARHFKSCAGMHRVYPHGVGRPYAIDRTSGRRVTTFKRSLALYRANNGPRNYATGEYDLDRDNDGISCEAL
jgi:hypothetical protein